MHYNQKDADFFPRKMSFLMAKLWVLHHYIQGISYCYKIAYIKPLPLLPLGVHEEFLKAEDARTHVPAKFPTLAQSLGLVTPAMLSHSKTAFKTSESVHSHLHSFLFSNGNEVHHFKANAEDNNIQQRERERLE